MTKRGYSHTVVCADKANHIWIFKKGEKLTGLDELSRNNVIATLAEDVELHWTMIADFISSNGEVFKETFVNLNKMKEPSFLLILTAAELGYQRDDGVYIVPIGCLRD
jgi:hypothetical protein